MNAAPGAFSTATDPPCGDDDVVHDGEAEPGAASATVASACVVELGEALEDPLTVGVGDAGPVVDDPEGDVGARLDERHDHLRAGVAGGVVEQVAHHAQELVGVAVDLRARHRAVSTVRASPVWTRRASARTISSRSTGERCAASSDRRVDHRDRQEVVDESLHADRVGEDLALRRLPVGELRMLEVDLELRADPGEGAAQLVAGVGDESPLTVGGVLEAGEHRVHRAGETADLVLARGLGHAPVEVLGADHLDLVADRLDRAQRATGDHPGEDAQEREQRRERPPQQAHQAVGAPGDAFEAARHVDHVGAGRGLHRAAPRPGRARRRARCRRRCARRSRRRRAATG